MITPITIPLHADTVPQTASQLSRYSRQISMTGIGLTGQLRLAAARVLVIGAGGLGSPIITYLARAGIGTIGVIDDDLVATSNLHRQIIHDDQTVGLTKVESAILAMRRANSTVEIIGYTERLDSSNAHRIIAEYDLVLDGTDDYATRYLVSDSTSKLGIPCVWGTVLETDGQVSTFWSAAPDGAVTLRDIYPNEPAAAEATCATAGVLGPLCGIVASWMAAEAVKLIAGFGRPLLGRLLTIDAFDSTTVEVTFAAQAHGLKTRPMCAVPEDVVTTWTTVSALAERLDGAQEKFLLVDVREEWERSVAVIEGSLSIPLGDIDAQTLTQLSESPVVVHCHHDTRAREASGRLRALGHPDVTVLRGGIDEWARSIDPTIARY